MTDPKTVVRDFYESYNGRDLDFTWERYIAANLVNHAMGGAYQRAEWLATDKTLLPAFADLHVEVLDQVGEGDKAATRYVKAFGTLAAGSLSDSANRIPRRAVLFYATDDDRAAAAIERLITVAGFDPVKVGGVNEAVRIEMPGGDLHQADGLGGRLLDADQAHAAVAAA